MIASLLLVMAVAGAGNATPDPTATALARCTDDAANASTAGQTGCETTATRAYDGRMNAAYAALASCLPPAARERLRQAQRAWLAFRDADALARTAQYATRSGTMYVPMEAAAAAAIVRDRAMQLEASLRVMRIEGDAPRR